MNTTEMQTGQSAAVLSRRVLSKDGTECSILVLAPGEQTSLVEVRPTRAHILFVIEGGVTVQTGDLTFLVKKDGALHLAAGQVPTVTADGTGWSKLLRIDLAPREAPAPPLYSFPNT